jgi:hypothetical protein
MKKEYEEKLQLAKEALAKYDRESPEYQEIVLSGLRLMEELVKTEDTKVLCELFDLFTPGNEYYVCEALEDLIHGYFTSDQVLQIFYQKFDSLAEKNPERCVKMACVNFFDRDKNDLIFEKFREMFNAVKSKYSGKFLEELKSFLFAGSCLHKIDEMNKICVHALEEDMKSW